MLKKILSVTLLICLISSTCFAVGNSRILNDLEQTDLELTLQEVFGANLKYDNPNEVVVGLDIENDKFIKDIPNIVKYEKLSKKDYLVTFEDAKTAKVMEQYLNSDPCVLYASLNNEIEIKFPDDFAIEKTNVGNLEESLDLNESEYPNDYAIYKEQWYLDDINSKKGWEAIKALNTPSDRSAVVAVIDTGIDMDNEDLKDRILKDSKGNYVTYNAAAQNNNASENTDGNYHGTKVSSIIAAEANNGYGICGVAGEFDVKILPIKVMSLANTISLSSIIRAVDYAIDQNVDVINMSLSIGGYNEALDELLKEAYEKGITVVCSAGNNYNSKFLYPASNATTISVGATTSSREKASFSQYNSLVDVVAPGQHLALMSSGGIVSSSGTSFSSPIIASVAALLKIVNPNLTPKEVEDAIKLSSVNLGIDGYDIEYGYGLVDIESAVNMTRYGHVEMKDIAYTKTENISVGEQYQIETQISPINADNTVLKFVSSDTSIAKVSGNGVVYGIRPGVANIYIIADDSYDLSFDENGDYKLCCQINVFPNNSSFEETVVNFGENAISNLPILDYDKFYLTGSDKVYRMRKDTDGSVNLAGIFSIKSKYKFLEYMPENENSSTASKRQNTFVMISDTGMIITSDTEKFEKKYAMNSPSYWDETCEFIGFASDGSSYTVMDNKKNIYYFNTNDTSMTKNKLYTFETDNTYNDVKYVSHEDTYMYVAVGKNENDECVVSVSNYGGNKWSNLTLDELPVFNQIVVDGQICYYLCDDAVYYNKIYRDGSGMKMSLPQKLTDIDNTKISKISLYSLADKNIVIGYGKDNNIYALSLDNPPEVLASFDGDVVEHAFAYSNISWAIVDGVLNKANVDKAESKSLTKELEIYDINFLDENKKLVLDVPQSGKFYVEYEVESVEEIILEHSSNSDLDNLYPAQIVTAVYEKATNKLVAAKTKNFMMERSDENTIFQWIEEFDLPKGEYTVKVMTFKGNNFYWPEKNNSKPTLDVFSYTLN